MSSTPSTPPKTTPAASPPSLPATARHSQIVMMMSSLAQFPALWPSVAKGQNIDKQSRGDSAPAEREEYRRTEYYVENASQQLYYYGVEPEDSQRDNPGNPKSCLQLPHPTLALCCLLLISSQDHPGPTWSLQHYPKHMLVAQVCTYLWFWNSEVFWCHFIFSYILGTS